MSVLQIERLGNPLLINTSTVGSQANQSDINHVPPGRAHFDPALNAWVLTQYADVLAALREARLCQIGPQSKGEAFWLGFSLTLLGAEVWIQTSRTNSLRTLKARN